MRARWKGILAANDGKLVGGPGDRNEFAARPFRRLLSGRESRNCEGVAQLSEDHDRLSPM